MMGTFVVLAALVSVLFGGSARAASECTVITSPWAYCMSGREIIVYNFEKGSPSVAVLLGDGKTYGVIFNNKGAVKEAGVYSYCGSNNKRSYRVDINNFFADGGTRIKC